MKFVTFLSILSLWCKNPEGWKGPLLYRLSAPNLIAASLSRTLRINPFGGLCMEGGRGGGVPVSRVNKFSRGRLGCIFFILL